MRWRLDRGTRHACGRHGRRRALASPGSRPGLSFLALVFALPLALPLFQSFRHADGGYGLGYEIAFFAEPFNIGVLMRRLRVAFLTTLLALVIGARTLGLNRMVQGQGLHLTAAICAIAADAGRSCL